MAKYDTKDIRNIVLIGHSDSGKTTLADALLFKAKAVSRLGSVEDGASVFDFEPEERERKVSIDLAAAFCSFQGREVNILDAPGRADFAGEAICGLNAVETALVCVHAASGIMVNTRKLWDRAAQAGVARVIVINKLEAENADYTALIKNILETFGPQCIPFNVPTGSGDGFKGVVSVLESSDKFPADVRELAVKASEDLHSIDDALLEKFMADERATPEELAKALPKALAQGKVIPVLCASVKRDVGVQEVLEFIAKYCPSPADVPPRKGLDQEKKGELTREPSVSAPLSAQVFKSIADPFVQRLAYIRVYSGTLTNSEPLFNQRTGKSGRIGGMFKPFGKEQRATPAAIAGDIVCVTKVDELTTCDTVCPPDKLVHYPPFKFPSPMVSLAVEPKSKQDLARLSEAMQKMADSDPCFRFTRDPVTVELVITGMSKLHMDVVIARLKRKFDVQLITKQPKIAYKEAILGLAEGHYKHKKQSGGRGQYGEVYLRVRPAARGEGFKFVDAITQGRIPQQFIPAIEKGIRETLERGVIAGYPVVDVEVEVFDGSYHEVDSGPESFKLAGSKAFKEAFKAAKPVMQEPIVTIEVVVPSRFMGDITGDLSSRRGRIQGMDSQGNLQVVRATIPMKEIQDYETQLQSVTGGEGAFSFEFSHYDAMPSQLADQLIAAKKADETEE
ncbi:MAG: elongation factor G [Planctomycetes bacterium]|nr:elongation factor G [Planctomycetota bacterium]